MRRLCLCCVFSILIHTAGCAHATDTSVQMGTVLIDPGHGGFDGGTVAEDGTVEKHLNLAVSLCLRDMLYICGVPVQMTRDTDVGLEEEFSTTIRSKKVSDMQNRLTMYNEADVVISIHQNHFSVPKYWGTQVFYASKRPESALLAEEIRAAVMGWMQPDNNRETKKATDGVYLLSHTSTPAVLVECGFLSNPEERNKLKTTAYRQQLAFAIMAGFWNYQSQL